MYIERKLETKIKKYLETPEIIAIIGPRQCGKTTLVRKIFDALENSLFISFEDISLCALFDEDPDTFCKLYITPYKYICIDEFQYSKTGGQRLLTRD
jgi:predicted AAA+ superfamily ATPase